MATLTNNALAEIENEIDYTPDAILPFLHEGGNFMSVPAGIERELSRLGFSGSGDELLDDFKRVLEKAGFSRDERKHAKRWLIDGSLPSPKYSYPIRLCFAFGLNAT